jgi:hypothetical protein
MEDSQSDQLSPVAGLETQDNEGASGALKPDTVDGGIEVDNVALGDDDVLENKDAQDENDEHDDNEEDDDEEDEDYSFDEDEQSSIADDHSDASETRLGGSSDAEEDVGCGTEDHSVDDEDDAHESESQHSQDELDNETTPVDAQRCDESTSTDDVVDDRSKCDDATRAVDHDKEEVDQQGQQDEHTSPSKPQGADCTVLTNATAATAPSVHPESLQEKLNRLSDPDSTSVSFCDEHLGDHDCVVLATHLRKTGGSQLVSLDLRGNQVGHAGAAALGEMLRMNSTLSQLSLEWNAIGSMDTAFATFASALEINGSLVQLDLRNNDIGPQVCVRC